MSFRKTTAIKKIQALERFVKGIQGGTSAGKTYGILPILIDICAKNDNTEVSVVSESLPHLKRGALRDFKKIMHETNRWIATGWHGTDSVYTFQNWSFIEFFGANEDAKLRGARRDYLYMNECNNLSFHAYTELASRTKIGVYLDWNPTNEFWFHEHLANDKDVDFLTINYLDNEACPESAVNFILSAKEKAKTSAFWDNWYKVYGLGELGNLEGVIFNNWKQIDNIPSDAELISYGMDFGFTNDPTTLVECYRHDGKLIFNELIYQTKLLNSDIIRMVKGNNNSKPIHADSAEPKSIQEILMAGIYIKPAIKGADSIKYGIDYLQQFDLLITSNSTNIIKELRNYQWDKDKAGKVLNKPIDAYNHSIDAMRYSVCELSQPTRKLSLI